MKKIRIWVVLGLLLVFISGLYNNGGQNVTSAATDWGVLVADSTIARYPSASALGGWGYVKGVFFAGLYKVWQRTQNSQYITYMRNWYNYTLPRSGFTALDYCEPGYVLLFLNHMQSDPDYQSTITSFRNQFNTANRTSDGGLWHANSRTNQLWADGVFMMLPFLCQYGVYYNDSTYCNNEAAKQLIVYHNHLKDNNTKLLWHAYDESGSQSWVVPGTKHSPEFWCRAMGWYAMTLVDVLDYLPANHTNRAQIISFLQDLVLGLKNYQDPVTGLWYEVVNKGHLSDNWHETSSSCMYAYTMSKAVEKGYIDSSYLAVVQKAYDGIMTKVSIGTDGRSNIRDIVEGTNVSNYAYYISRPRTTNDLHGIGAFLIMYEQLNKTPMTPPPTPTATITPTPTITPPPPTSTPGSNLALNKPVTCSSEQTGNEAYKIVDGDAVTNRWSASPYPQWVRIDLGTVYSINKTELVPYSNRAYRYKIEVSIDGSTYSQIVDQTANTTGGALLTDTFAIVSARYVRLSVTGCYNYTGTWASVIEFRVFGPGATVPPSIAATPTNTPTPSVIITPTNTPTPSVVVTPTPTASSGINLALNKPVTCSSEQTGNEAYKLVDGDAVTNRWSASPYPQWVRIDLGANYSINKTELAPLSNRAYRYKVEVSTDGANYTQVVDRTGNTTGGSLLTDTFTAINARYVRLTVTGCYNYTGTWISIIEFRVF